MTFKCVSWVIFSLASLAAWQWTNWCLWSRCVPSSDVFNEEPVYGLASAPSPPGWGGCEPRICRCGIWEEDDNDNTWEVLRIIWWAPSQNRVSSSQLVYYTQHESCCMWLRIAGVSHSLKICNQSVRCCLFVSRDKLGRMTAEISWLSDIHSTIFEGKDVCWCLSQIIPRIIPTNQR